MSVTINLKPSPNAAKWAGIKNGDFLVLEGTDEHPIPNGLYRAFIGGDDAPNIFLMPLFNGPFQDNLFPYIIEYKSALPTLVHIVNNISIDVEFTQ